MVQDNLLNHISYLQLWKPFVLSGGTICAISVAYIMEKLLLEYFTSGSITHVNIYVDLLAFTYIAGTS